MAQIQIPNYAAENLARDQSFRNQMQLESQLKSQRLAQQRVGMENEEMARTDANRRELEMLLQHTAPEEQERAAFEWSRVKDPEFHQKLAAQQIHKLAQLMGANPQGALANFERATGEKLEYDPTAGVAQIDFGPSGKLAVNARGQMELIKPPSATQQQQRGTVLPPGAGYIPPGQQEVAFTQPQTNRPENLSDPESYAEKMAEQYQTDTGKPATSGQKAKWMQEYITANARSRNVEAGLGRFVGLDAQGNPIAYVPSRGGAGRLTPIASGAGVGAGPLRPATTGFEERRAASNARSGLRALSTVREMLKDPNILKQASIPGSPWARKFEAARKEMVDVLTRLRTGAALNVEEEKFYTSQAPTLLDLTDPPAIEYKLKQFEDLFNDLATGGVGNTAGTPAGAPPRAPAPGATPGGGTTAPNVMRGKSKSGKPIISKDGGKTWEYE